MNSTAGPERMGRIPAEKYTAEQKQVAATIIAGPRGEVRGPFAVMLRSPGLLGPVQQVGEYLRFKCPLEKRIIELATILVARHWAQQYEWFSHAELAVKAGLRPEIVDAIAEGRRPSGMAQGEEVVYDFITELLTTRGVSDKTYERTVSRYGENGVVDITGIVGYYSLIGMQMNVARTALPDGKPLPLPRFPL
jgi:4-carboxymuconolactone decarboxylase